MPLTFPIAYVKPMGWMEQSGPIGPAAVLIFLVAIVSWVLGSRLLLGRWFPLRREKPWVLARWFGLILMMTALACGSRVEAIFPVIALLGAFLVLGGTVRKRKTERWACFLSEEISGNDQETRLPEDVW